MEMRTISTKRMSNALHYLFLFSKDAVIGLDYVYIFACTCHPCTGLRRLVIAIRPESTDVHCRSANTFLI